MKTSPLQIFRILLMPWKFWPKSQTKLRRAIPEVSLRDSISKTALRFGCIQNLLIWSRMTIFIINLYVQFETNYIYVLWMKALSKS